MAFNQGELSDDEILELTISPEEDMVANKQSADEPAGMSRSTEEDGEGEKVPGGPPRNKSDFKQLLVFLIRLTFSPY